ncbi:hypothetical protein D3C71_1827530 [compost metagenome]
MSLGVPASTVMSGSAENTRYSQGAAHSPSRKASLQPPPRSGDSSPPRMPLMPAMRPAPSISSTAAAPISRPPAVPAPGVKADQSTFT